MNLNDLNGQDQAGPHLQRVIAKVSKIVSYIRKSNLATDHLEGETRLQPTKVHSRNCTKCKNNLRMPPCLPRRRTQCLLVILCLV